MLFKLEEGWANLAPKQRHERRARVTRPMLDDFFAWAERVWATVRDVRGPVATAFGYVIRQRDALRRFLDDGRLRLENNAAERALRSSIAVGRKAWLFFGSDDHAQAAANIFSLIASCQLHDQTDAFVSPGRVGPASPRRSGNPATHRFRSHSLSTPTHRVPTEILAQAASRLLGVLQPCSRTN